MLSTVSYRCFVWSETEKPGAETQTPSHPVPLSLFVEQNDDQLGVHLVSVLAERQITPLERHIHQVPAEGNIGDGDRERDRLRHTSLAEKPHYLLYISWVILLLKFHSSAFLFRQTQSTLHKSVVCYRLVLYRLLTQLNDLTLIISCTRTFKQSGRWWF